MSQFRANIFFVHKQEGGAGLKTVRRVAVVHSAFSHDGYGMALLP